MMGEAMCFIVCLCLMYEPIFTYPVSVKTVVLINRGINARL